MRPAPSTSLPIKRDLTLAYRLSLAVAALMAVASAAGIVLGLGGLYGPDPTRALGVTEAEAGLLLPGLLGQDLFNLILGAPLLLGSMWLARRGSLVGLLLWPGMLFYALYWYVLYMVGAPFGVLFLLYVPLVTLSAYATVALLASVDGEAVRRRLAGVVPARIIGGILVVLALLTFGQDATGALVTALAGDAPVDSVARHVWISDLALQAPAVLTVGVLLWLRRPLGYATGAGLLFQYGLSAVGFVFSMALAAVLTGSAFDIATSVVLLVFGAVCFVPLVFFLRGARASGAETSGTSAGVEEASITNDQVRTEPRATQRAEEGRGR